MASATELALKYTRKFKPTVFDSGIGARLPAAYRKFYDEWRNTPREAVHYIPHTGKPWIRDPTTGEVKRVENIPLPFHFPKELNDVFTGGEVVIQGFTKKKKYNNRVPRFWMPRVQRSVIYSEILDKYLSTLMTKRAIELIIKHGGLDSYLLETKACDLVSLVALKLKRSLLFALSNKDLPYDAEKNNSLLKKYEKYLIPREEIEWYGLSFGEACKKLKEIEEAKELAAIVPLKHVYRAQLLEDLRSGKLDKSAETTPEKTGEKETKWYQRIPGLGPNKRNT